MVPVCRFTFSCVFLALLLSFPAFLLRRLDTLLLLICITPSFPVAELLWLFFYPTFQRICIGDIFAVAPTAATRFSCPWALNNGSFVPGSFVWFLLFLFHTAAASSGKQITNQPNFTEIFLLSSPFAASEGSKQIQGETKIFQLVASHIGLLSCAQGFPVPDGVGPMWAGWPRLPA